MNQQLALVPVPHEEERAENRVKGKKRGKILKNSTLIRQFSITFNLVKAPEDEVTYVLKVDKVNDVPMAEKTPPPEGEEEEGGNVVEQHLPVTDLLEQWSLEVRQRDTGRRDKVYFHGRSTRRFRSLVEVSNFIGDNYYSSQKLQVRLEKKKIPLKKMDDVAANNDGHNMAGILAIMPLNQETESDDDTQDTISTADDSGNLVDVPVVYSFEEMESEVKQGVNTGDDSGNKEKIPEIPEKDEMEI